MASGWSDFRKAGRVAGDEKLRRLGLLVVDDESDIVHALGALFRQHFDIYSAHSAAQALELFKEHAPKLVITDRRMPEMTGLQLLATLKEIDPTLVTVLVTGYSDIHVVVDALNAGLVWQYVTKPWDHKQLRELVVRGARAYLSSEGLDDSSYARLGVLGC